MKKNSIIAVLIIYIAAFLIVGFFGMNMKVYNPVVYTEEIVWNHDELSKNNQYKIKELSEEEIEKEDVNAKLSYTSSNLGAGVTFNIKCYAKPTNADNVTLDYHLEVNDASACSIKVLPENTCDILFKKTCSAILVITTTDSTNIKYKILFEISDLSDIF